MADQRLETVEIDERMREYLYKLTELGLLEGPLGAMEHAPEIRPIIEAIHHVLAGGVATVTVVKPGVPDVVDDLERRLEDFDPKVRVVG